MPYILIPFFLGIIDGVLINILVDTLPHSSKEPHCPNPNCRSSLLWIDYLLGRDCSHCGKHRWVRFWILIVTSIIVSVLLWLHPIEVLGYWLGMAIFSYLVLVAVIDLEFHLIIRWVSVAGILLGFLTGYLTQGIISTLLGAASGFIILFTLYLFGKLFSKIRAKRKGNNNPADEALGSGDVTLALILGLMVGWPLIWFNILFGVLLAGALSLLIILGLLVTRRYKENAFMVFIPLGPGFILITFLIIYFPQFLSSVIKG